MESGPLCLIAVKFRGPPTTLRGLLSGVIMSHPPSGIDDGRTDKQVGHRAGLPGTSPTAPFLDLRRHNVLL